MGNSAHKQLQKRGRDIRCLSAGGASWDGHRTEQLFVRNFPSALDFFAFFFDQAKKKGQAGEANLLIEVLKCNFRAGFLEKSD